MKVVTSKKISELRKMRNKDILMRMDEGDNLSSYKSYASWFPPRPVLEKDARAIARLYGQNVDTRLGNAYRKASGPEKEGSGTQASVRLLRPAS